MMDEVSDFALQIVSKLNIFNIYNILFFFISYVDMNVSSG